jgi:hypothetical protein
MSLHRPQVILLGREKLQRPVSIIYFERFFWASMLAGLVGSYVGWDAAMAQVARDMPAMQSQTAIALAVAILVVFLAIWIAFWYAIARRASNVAKWIYVVLSGLGVLQTLASLFQPAAFGGIEFGLSLFSTALSIGSMICLFRANAVAWLTGKGPVDSGIFL